MGDKPGSVGAPVIPATAVLRRFWPDVRPFAPALAGALVASVLSPLLETAGVWVFKRIVDEVLVPRDLGHLGPLALVTTGLVLADAAVGAADRLLSAWASESFLVALRTRVFHHLLRLPVTTLERRPAGDLLSRIEADSSAVGGFLLCGLSGAISDLLRVLFFAGALMRLDLALAGAAMAAVPLFAVAVRRFAARIRQAARDERRHLGGAGAVAQEGITAAALVQAFGREDVLTARFASEARAVMRAHLAGTRQRALLSPLLDLVDLAGGLTVVALGTWALTHDRLSLGGLLAFITYLGKMYHPVRALGGFAGQALSAAAAAERVLEILSEAPALPPSVDRRARPAPARVRGAVQFEHVSFRYPGADRDALHDVSLELAPGRTLAVVGPSGAGKSTLARLLLRLCEPTAGRILLDGVDIRELPVEALRAAVALVPQETVLFHASVRDNIAFGRLEATEREVRESARLAGADDFVRSLPDGYATVLGERGMRLSGGQRQRIALARALVRDAPVLVLDEPTTGLDPTSARRVLAAASRACVDRAALLVITHDLRSVRRASEIVLLEHGGVAERGRHDQLAACDGAYAGFARGVPVRAAGER